MNRKGQVLKWGVPIFILAFILFIGSSANRTSGHVKGQWQTDFINDNYLEAKKIQLESNIKARNVGLEIVWELSANGGFTSESSCGKFNDFNLWNKRGVECVPPIEEVSITRADEIFKSKNLAFKNLRFIENSFFGDGEIIEVKSDVGTYFHQGGFAIPLNYEFLEYDLLFNQARTLLSKCRNQDDLKQCLDTNKESYWHYTSCDSEDYNEDLRKVSFCVISPNLYQIRLKDENKQEIVSYKLALDFSPLEALGVTGIITAATTEHVEVKFKFNQFIDSYRIYVTSHQDVTTGKAKDVSSGVFSDFWREFSFSKTELNACTDEKSNNKPYLCDGNVVYLINNNDLPQGDSFKVSVTSKKTDDKGIESESDIEVWV